MCPSPDTRSPTLNPRTSLPISTMLPAVLMADRHGHRNGLLRPLIPLVDVHVGAADRRLGDLDQHVVRADRRLRDIHHPDAGSRFFLDERFHRLSLSLNAELAAGGRERFERAIELPDERGCGHLRADAGLALRHHREGEPR